MAAPTKRDERKRIDLNAMRAAATEAAAERDEPVEMAELVLGDIVFEIPAKAPPFLAGVHLQEGNISAGFRELFGEDKWREFLATRPTESDIGFLVVGVAEVYGLSVPNSVRSGLGLPSDGIDLKPTSNGSTASTSPGRSGPNRASRRAASRPSAKGSPTKRKASSAGGRASKS